MTSKPGDFEQTAFVEGQGTTYSRTPTREVAFLPEQALPNEGAPRVVAQDEADSQIAVIARRLARSRQSAGLVTIAKPSKDNPDNVFDMRVAEHRDHHRYGSTTELISSHESKSKTHKDKVEEVWTELFEKHQSDIVEIVLRNFAEVVMERPLSNEITNGEIQLTPDQEIFLGQYFYELASLRYYSSHHQQTKLFSLITSFYRNRGFNSRLRALVKKRRDQTKT